MRELGETDVEGDTMSFEGKEEGEEEQGAPGGQKDENWLLFATMTTTRDAAIFDLPADSGMPRSAETEVAARMLGWNEHQCSLHDFLYKERLHRHGLAHSKVPPTL
eukprot:CAMPEP_0173410472 /NCGR_PEP_ID=MMETSP1356-20130122/74712_1 /TAXON_ID=77927 ORGANISM="Hemiselmis virescens, Strain PCC157" /NCGR_SAMPLE_ID=MMETSP1356 /ASSEMBLY_ACC=CAM_ASM_000847 /LENGTH=105 /DNA_ID=CAMNT_0014372097 /DNA_START=166 /DNA_END=480 /DNA_ORIENTATION=+